MCCCRCKSLAKVRLKITTQEKCNIWCWHSNRKIKQADFINFALVCRPFGSQKTPSNQVERANGLTKTTAAHFTRNPLLGIVIIYQVEHVKSQKARKVYRLLKTPAEKWKENKGDFVPRRLFTHVHEAGTRSAVQSETGAADLPLCYWSLALCLWFLLSLLRWHADKRYCSHFLE